MIAFVAIVLLGFTGQAVFGMDIIVVVPGGRELKITAEPEDTIAEVKEKIHYIAAISPLNQYIFKGNTRLKDKETLVSYNIENGDTLLVKHGISKAPTKKEHGGIWIFLAFLAILGVGFLCMRKKPSREFDGK